MEQISLFSDDKNIREEEIKELQELKDNSEELTNVLIQLDNALEYLHNHGYCIYDFEPKKIVLYDN